MKNKILKRTFALILILCLLFSFTPVYSYTQSVPVPNYYKNTDLGIIAYKQVSAFQVQLADGSILLDAGISTGSDVNVIENMSDVEIVFILDTSSSMADGSRDKTTKEATKALVNALFERIGAEHLKIGVLFFNTTLDNANILELTNDQNTITSHLDKLYASGNTYMEGALEKANSMLTSTSNDNKIKIVCTLSDGALMDQEASLEEFRDINSAKISTISIFVDTPITPAFANLAASSELHKNMETSTANLAETIVEDIYNEIYFKLIIMSEPVTTYTVNHEGVLIGGDKIIFQVDEEILHGATLRIEYVISITTAFDMNNIVINDLYSSDFVFSQDSPLLSEASKTNRDYGWQMNGNSLVTSTGNQTIKAATEYRTKLILSTVLTPERLPDLSLIGNSMEFSLNDIDSNNSISVGRAANIKALDFLIIPPTGTEDSITEDLLFLLKVTIFALAAVIFVAFIHNHLRERRRYYK